MFKSGKSPFVLLAAVALPALLSLLMLVGSAGAWDLLPGEKPPSGPQIVLDLHCHVCHVMPGAENHSLLDAAGQRIIPILDFEADRTRPEWTLEFFKEPFHLRPELHAQMPNFAMTDAEAMKLVSFLMTLKLKQEVYYPEEMLGVTGVKDAAELKKAKDTFDLYKCFQCHLLEGKVIDPEKGQSGPDFIHTYNRLNIPWNYQWLVDPQAYIPGTKMPNFFYSDGEELIDEPERDMYYILVYMYSLGEHKDYADYKKLEKEHPADPDGGKKLAEELWCSACHEFEGWDKVDPKAIAEKDERMDLTHIGSKRDKAWLKKHMGTTPTNPREESIGHWPGYILNDYELNTLVDYLSTIK